MDDPEAWESANAENAMFKDAEERGKFDYGYEEDGQKFMFSDDDHKEATQGFYNVSNASDGMHVDGEDYAEQYKNQTGIYAPKEKNDD